MSSSLIVKQRDSAVWGVVWRARDFGCGTCGRSRNRFQCGDFVRERKDWQGRFRRPRKAEGLFIRGKALQSSQIAR